MQNTKKTQPTQPTQPIQELQDLAKTLQIDAVGLGIPSGAAKIFVAKSLDAAAESLQGKSILTAQDVKRAVYKELKKYSTDLAYVYRNRDKII